MKLKLVVFLLLTCLTLSFMVVLVTANPGSVTVTLNLHKASSVGAINTKSTAGQIFNTTASWSGVVQENSSEVSAAGVWSVFFYLSPTLAGTLTFNGIMIVTPFVKANATVADVTLITTLNKISAGGVRTLISTKSDAGVGLNGSYFSKSSTHGAISTTVTSTNTLELNITFADSASDLTYTVGYDTAAVRSRITLIAEDPVTISLASNLGDYKTNDAPVLTGTVTDVFGGYDIASSPSLAFGYPPGLTCTLVASSYGDTQYSNTYVYTFITPAEGTWTPTATTTDRTGNSYTSSISFRVNPQPGPGNLNPLDVIGGPSGNVNIAVIVGLISLAGLCVWVATKKPKRRRHR